MTLAYPRLAFPGAFPGGGLAALGWSGYLVPAVDGRAVKAVTFSSVKWPHLAEATASGAEPLEIVRCSVGRIGEEALLQRADEDLAALAAAELAAATGVHGAPVAHRITRWGGALPQYTVGHLDRVARIRAAVATQPGWPSAGRPTRESAYPPALRRPARRPSGDGVPPRWPTIVDMADEPQMIQPGGTSPEAAAAAGKPKARDLNELIRYTMWSVFRVSDRTGLDAGGHGNASAEVADLFDQAAGKGIVTRGCYDVQGFRADADFMFWWVAPTSDDLQDLYVRFRRTRLGRCSEPVWSVMALHRPAEFNKGHIPAYLADEEPRAYLSVYPFVRSYEWYLLDPGERRTMLADHGMMAREYPDVRANTVPCFALNDYEWILAFEADELHRILDLMRHLRGSEARRHTRLEIPFYTGHRKPVHDLVADLA